MAFFPKDVATLMRLAHWQVDEWNGTLYWSSSRYRCKRWCASLLAAGAGPAACQCAERTTREFAVIGSNEHRIDGQCGDHDDGQRGDNK